MSSLFRFLPPAVVIGLLAIDSLFPRLWNVQEVSGVVRTAAGQPASGALIRVKNTTISTEADIDGHFLLSGFDSDLPARLTCWKKGYYVAGKDVWPWDTKVVFRIEPYAVADNHRYSWIPPAVDQRSAPDELFTQAAMGLAAEVSFRRLFLPLSEQFALGCRDCHGQAINDQWVTGAHALGTQNPRFMSMYNGSDLSGNVSPATRRGRNRDYGSFRLRPDPDRPYFGPGYKLDFPETSGNCAACHLPSAAIEKPYGIDPNEVQGVDALGTHCDFCHKISGVKLNPATGRPFENMPGILSIELMRPDPERQLFFGPYDDVDVGPDTYLPLMKESEICAPCHDASFWGVPIYESFAEWLASPYPAQGTTCQSCHMKPDGVCTNFAPFRGGLERDPQTVATHHFPGAADTTLLQNAVTMETRVERQGELVVVTVIITNDKTGHHVPTDSPLRQMILLVRVSDEQARVLPLLEGSRVPEWGGVGDPDEGYYAGLPGNGFAKVLEEVWTGVSPTGAYWNRTRIVKDNRIAAFADDTSIYRFSAPPETEVSIEVTLLFRRAFIELMEQKNWQAPDIVMARQAVLLRNQLSSFTLSMEPPK